MKIRTKILGGFILAAILSLLLGITYLVLTKWIANEIDSLSEFQNDVAEFTGILTAHYTWRNNLTVAILTDSEFTGSLDPGTCALGQWMKGDQAKSITDPEVLRNLRNVVSPHDFIHHEAATVIAMLERGDKEAAIVELTDVILPVFSEVITELTAIMNRFNVLIAEKTLGITEIENVSMAITISMLVVVLVVSLLLAIFITRSIIKPLARITAAAEELSAGNLEVDANYHINDEIGRLAESFKHLIDATKEQVNVAEMLAGGDLTAEVRPRGDSDAMSHAMIRMLDNLNHMFTEVHTATNQVSAGAKQIADGAQSLAQGSTEQAASIEQLSSSIAEIAHKTKNNAEIAERTAKLEEGIMVNAEKGSRHMDEMMTAVSEITQASQNIQKVIKVIDDIAFQTNILALNAAVEAARAGQHGKGFAVVAEEVRNLAAKSAEAARETGGMIQNSMEKAELGARIADETASSLRDILSGINESSGYIREIAQASEEQSVGVEQINTGIDQVAQVVQHNSATAEQEAAASEEMSGQSAMLQSLISQFKLKNRTERLQLTGKR